MDSNYTRIMHIQNIYEIIIFTLFSTFPSFFLSTKCISCLTNNLQLLSLADVTICPAASSHKNLLTQPSSSKSLKLFHALLFSKFPLASLSLFNSTRILSLCFLLMRRRRLEVLFFLFFFSFDVSKYSRSDSDLMRLLMLSSIDYNNKIIKI